MLTVVIDSGHTAGGYDPGAVGPSGVKEGIINWRVANLLKDKLEQRGITAVLTHNGPGLAQNTRDDLNYRAAYIRKIRPFCCVSIHCNSATNASAHGTETYYYQNPNSKKLANLIQNYLILDLHRLNRKVKSANFAMTREPDKAGIPSVLVELAFVSNSQEEILLNSIAEQEIIANAILKGVLAFMNIPNEPTAWDKEKDAAAVWVKENSLSDGTRPNEPITRAELWAILRRYDSWKK